METQIKFGTDGWRAEIARDFTFANVERVTAAFIKYLKSSNLASRGVAVGYDNRFQSEDFAKLAASICAGAQIKTYYSEISLPSPALSYFVNSKKLGAGIMITASHNPSGWNGFKIKEDFGGSSRPEVTKAVEKEIGDFKPNRKSGSFEIFNPKEQYLKHIASFVDLDKIKSSGMKVFLDPMNGSGAGYLKELLPEIVEINGNRDPLFHGINPEPLPINLLDLASIIKDAGLANPMSIGVAIDGDADRIAGYDPDGTYISSHNVFSLILKHLYENKHLRGKVVKTFNISRIVEKQSKAYGLELVETPIGFKYIAEQFLSADVLIGGEESGGLGIKGNIPERDGSLNALLLMELVAQSKKTLSQNLKEIMAQHGFYSYDRVDLKVEREKFFPIVAGLAQKDKFGGNKIVNIENLDGTKLNFADESWILFRGSGTEPLLRIYAEGRSMDQVELLLSEGQKLFKH